MQNSKKGHAPSKTMHWADSPSEFAMKGLRGKSVMAHLLDG
jgi:hypothetical protein